MLKFFQHFKALFWKNLKSKWRKPFSTSLEILFPLQLVFVLWLFSFFSATFNEQMVRHYPVNEVSKFWPKHDTSLQPVIALSCDNNPKSRNIIRPIAKILQEKGYKTEIIDDKITYLSNYKKYYADLHFQYLKTRSLDHTSKDYAQNAVDTTNSNVNDMISPDGIHLQEDEYIEVMIVNRTYNSFDSMRNQTNVFVTTGFVHLQNLVYSSFDSYNYPNSNLTINIKSKQFPSKGYNNKILEMSKILIYSLYFSLSVMANLNPLLVTMVNEKKLKLKTGLKMMGCNMFAYYCSWFVGAVIETTIVSILLTILSYVFGILWNTSILIFFYSYYMYFLSMIPFIMTISLFFSDPKIAAIAMNLISLIMLAFWIALRILYFFEIPSLKTAQYIVNFLSPYTFTELIFHMFNEEKTGGINFGNMFEKSNEFFSVPLSMIYLFVNLILYNLIGLYLEQVISTEGGKARHPLFFLMPNFWKDCFQSIQSPMTGTSPPIDSQGEGIEMEDNENESLGIEILNLTKKFTQGIIKRKTVIAVENLSLTINKGEIFAILGQNGAGKTTTINMLVGNVLPTNGVIRVNGQSTEDDMDAIRQQLGVCPQEDLIFEYLTCWEHMSLYAAIKNVSPLSLKAEIEDLLQQVDLLSEKNNKVKNFSGGMKRRLSFAISLLGDSAIVVLDEPTTGLDPVNRKRVWEILQKIKSTKTIVLTTHNMEEADLLADRIAIMKTGKLEVCGSSLSLKNHYGVGYTLSFTKEADCNENEVISFVRSHISEAEKSPRSNQREIGFLIPYRCVSLFPTFLKELENKMLSLKLHSYGLSVTTLEEVFLKINEA